MHPDCPRRSCSCYRGKPPWSVRSGASPTWWWRPLPRPKLRRLQAWYPSAATRRSMRFPVPENRAYRTGSTVIHSGNMVVDTNGYKPIMGISRLSVQRSSNFSSTSCSIRDACSARSCGSVGLRLLRRRPHRRRAYPSSSRQAGRRIRHVIGTVRNVGYRFDPPEEKRRRGGGRTPPSPQRFERKLIIALFALPGIAICDACDCHDTCDLTVGYLTFARDCIFMRR